MQAARSSEIRCSAWADRRLARTHGMVMRPRLESMHGFATGHPVARDASLSDAGLERETVSMRAASPLIHVPQRLLCCQLLPCNPPHAASYCSTWRGHEPVLANFLPLVANSPSPCTSLPRGISLYPP